MILYNWAKRHNIPLHAIRELEIALGVIDNPGIPATGLSEAAVQQNLRLEGARSGVRLFRNNVGGTYDDEGNFIRYGLANDSEKMNKTIKSGDLIGIRPIIITEHMVGSTIGQFVSREAKKGGWRFSNTEREQAQLNWINLIISLGGDACFASGPGTL